MNIVRNLWLDIEMKIFWKINQTFLPSLASKDGVHKRRTEFYFFSWSYQNFALIQGSTFHRYYSYQDL